MTDEIDWTTGCATKDSALSIGDIKPNYNMTFHNNGKQVGAIDWNGPEMTFTGDVDESARMFFDWIAEAFKGRLEQERAAEREKVAAWMIHRGYATGHGDTTEDLLKELDWQVLANWSSAMKTGAENEREACAKVCDELGEKGYVAEGCAAAIRARKEAT
jgi:hypothetical protein